MSSIHGHEVLQMMLASGESTDSRLAGGRHSPPLWRRGAVSHLFSRESKRRTAGGVFREKGKFIAREEGFTTAENKICRH